MASTDPETRQRLLADLLIGLLATNPIPMALIGGQATNYWARPRYTDDFDFTVAADPAGIAVLVRSLTERGFRVVREQEGGSPSGPDFVRLERTESHDAIDLIVAKTEFQDLLIQRAIRGGSGTLPIATPEDLLILKLIANRPKDHNDIFRLIESQAIDWEYVEHWAEMWQVGAILSGLRDIASRATGLQ